MRGVSILIAVALAGLGTGAPAQAATPEVEVKAAYLFKLASFVRWPNPLAGDDPFRICVAGRPDIGGALGTMARNQQVSGRPVAVVQLAGTQAQQAQSCQILFVGRGPQTARTMLQATSGAPVLTVTDRSAGTRGGVIEFMLGGGKVRLAIDRGEANARKLELSSKLMDVAAEVRP